VLDVVCGPRQLASHGTTLQRRALKLVVSTLG
jgi:hypothetical protein